MGPGILTLSFTFSCVAASVMGRLGDIISMPPSSAGTKDVSRGVVSAKTQVQVVEFVTEVDRIQLN